MASETDINEVITRLGTLGEKGRGVSAAARRVKDEQRQLVEAVQKAREVLSSMSDQIEQRESIHRGQLGTLQTALDRLKESADASEQVQIQNLQAILDTLDDEPTTNVINQAIQQLDTALGGKIAQEATTQRLRAEDAALSPFGQPRLRPAASVLKERTSGTDSDISTRSIRGTPAQMPGTALRRRRGAERGPQRGTTPDEGVFAGLGRALGLTGPPATKDKTEGGGRRRRRRGKGGSRTKKYRGGALRSLGFSVYPSGAPMHPKGSYEASQKVAQDSIGDLSTACDHFNLYTEKQLVPTKKTTKKSQIGGYVIKSKKPTTKKRRYSRSNKGKRRTKKRISSHKKTQR